jgi:ABC-2 type transport system permease protein
MKRYLKLWYIYSLYSTQIGLQSRFGAVLFMVGKFMRFGIFLFFIFLLSSTVKEISGYTFWEMMLIFATFNLIDVSSQFFFREVYRFRNYVVDGSVDYFLVRPMKPLFRFLLGGADIFDVPLFIISILLVVLSLVKIGDLSFIGLFSYIVLVLNGLLIALAFHVLVLTIGILSTVVDNALWLYGDIVEMGKIPINLYQKPLSSILTFLIPVGVMITFPAQAAFGELMPQLILVSFMICFGLLLFSVISWRFALKRYASASS